MANFWHLRTCRSSLEYFIVDFKQYYSSETSGGHFKRSVIIYVSDSDKPSGEGTGFRCLPGYWKCSSLNICIKNTWTCDGYNDCHDKSDESDMLCSE